MANCTDLVYIVPSATPTDMDRVIQESCYRSRVLERLTSSTNPVTALTIIDSEGAGEDDLEFLNRCASIQQLRQVRHTLGNACTNDLRVLTALRIPQDTLENMTGLESLCAPGSAVMNLSKIHGLKQLEVQYEGLPMLINPSHTSTLQSLNLRFGRRLWHELHESLLPHGLLQLDTLPALRSLSISVQQGATNKLSLAWCSGQSTSLVRVVLDGPFLFRDLNDLGASLLRFGPKLQTLSVKGLRCVNQDTRLYLPVHRSLSHLERLEWHDTDPCMARFIALPSLKTLLISSPCTLKMGALCTLLANVGKQLSSLALISLSTLASDSYQVFGISAVYHLLRWLELKNVLIDGAYYFEPADWTVINARLQYQFELLYLRHPDYVLELPRDLAQLITLSPPALLTKHDSLPLYTKGVTKIPVTRGTHSASEHLLARLHMGVLPLHNNNVWRVAVNGQRNEIR